MGGCGSGRHHGARNRRVESCLGLDVNELRRKGALTPGATGTLTWERDGDAACVAFRADKAALILSYHDQYNAEPRDVEQHIALSSVPAAFGGSRVYFLCPGTDCARRVSILYFARGSFRCRRCHRLAYKCQMENITQRARRRADKLRARLGWPQHRALGLPIVVVRPKGMWNRTFERVRGDAIAAESVATAAQVAQWARLLGRLERRRRRAQQA
jgi:hypothetical protein